MLLEKNEDTALAEAAGVQSGQHESARLSLWECVNQWRGVALSMILAVSTIWLAWADMLTFFIHPRYVFFTVEMAVLALAASVWAIWRGVPADEHEHDHAHGAHDAYGAQAETSQVAQPDGVSATDESQRWPRRMPTALTGAASLVLIVSVAAMVLVAPPAPLSATLASERALAGGGVGERSTGKAVITTLAQLPEEVSVGDWAQLLANAPAEEVLGEKTTLDGFVIAPEQIAEHGYYLVRFQIACCAVDALPVGVPVMDPNWRDKYGEGQWLRVSGEFTPNPGMPFPEEAVLTPGAVEAIDEPEQPYLF